MKRLIAIALSFSMAAPALASAEQAWGYGLGLYQCSQWTMDIDQDVAQYIYGVYSGMNIVMQARNGRQVHAGADKAVRDVARYCRTHRDTLISNAAALSWVSSANAGE